MCTRYHVFIGWRLSPRIALPIASTIIIFARLSSKLLSSFGRTFTSKGKRLFCEVWKIVLYCWYKKAGQAWTKYWWERRMRWKIREIGKRTFFLWPRTFRLVLIHCYSPLVQAPRVKQNNIKNVLKISCKLYYFLK